MSNIIKYESEPLNIKRIVKYFLKGLLFIAPITITIYIILMALRWVDSLIPAIEIPGLGFAIIISSITVIGFIVSTFVSKSISDYIERWIIKIPLIGLIYSSLKELMGAFVGEQKKFSKPVIVTMDSEGILRRLGFITQDDLSNLGMEDMVAVYFPHSYNFSGNFYFVPRKHVKPIKVSNTHYMKFIVSGGMTAIPKAAFEDEQEASLEPLNN